MSKPLTRSAQKRQDIVNAAVAEFTESGFQGTSMDRISSRANVSKRTVYNHFESKEDLFTHITQELWDQCINATKVPYCTELPLDVQLSEIASCEMAFFASDQTIDMARAVIAEHFHDAELAKKTVEHFEQAETGLQQWLNAAVADGKLDIGDTEFAAQQFLSLLKAFAFWPQLIGHLPRPTEDEKKFIIGSAVSMFLKQYQTA